MSDHRCCISFVCRFYRVRCGKTVQVFISLGYSLFGILELTVLLPFFPFAPTLLPSQCGRVSPLNSHSDVQALLWWLAALNRVTKEHWIPDLSYRSRWNFHLYEWAWGTAAGLAPLCLLFLLLLDRQESQTLRKPVTSWTYIRTGRNQILPRLTRVSPPLLGPLQWGARWTWHEGGRAWSTCCWWLGSSCMWRYHYVDHVHTSSKKNWLHLRDYLNLSLQPWVQRWRQCYGM